MSDLCSPLYVVLEGDEAMTFWCFTKLMERMVRLTTLIFKCVCVSADTDFFSTCQKSNFLRDQSGMKAQLSNLQELLANMDPQLHRHLGTSVICVQRF